VRFFILLSYLKLNSYAILKFSERSEAQNAINFGNGKFFHGKFIVVG
jgi:RNA recognition motif-containing protein